MADCDSLKVPFFRASIGKDDEEAVLRVLHSGWLTTGKEALAFEQEFAAKIQVPYALAVNSNTSGMVLAMEACGVGAGKAVITTPYTFVSTAACARLLEYAPDLRLGILRRKDLCYAVVRDDAPGLGEEVVAPRHRFKEIVPRLDGRPRGGGEHVNPLVPVRKVLDL